ncbi:MULTISPECIES: hypothetical protein [Streptomyces]|uniref:DUF7144 domain-containing protein n=1 Tax=Streptomyces glycanivorans TaxID=3033808 RepID=A0ABY9JLD3_9ACTN|nr:MULTISPECIES: hypothetical protein [unclassified Streptomyces]WSQ80225.1 hypothetical protein OG725_25385 [Streptomyces sp. NBC_01213]TXS08735.1 hypothetical protein EAO68_32025 [Streptomyces sp. wa22]WLQ66807.1 hypothetical protein P8A20_25960 [Streptomyces sp. Alt3]WSQ87556.1 hypothetical protein OG722_25810 [Streptomyces sp. NBC_01212]WSR06433.1 hypothetical protein OG265_10650 [Streptomyces sp. NBC_01208]
MAQSAPAPGSSRPSAPGPAGPWAETGVMFAGVLLLVDGILGVVKGIAGIASDEVYTRIDDYTFKFGITAWGWIHLVLGVILVVVGWSILKGAAWAWGVGIGLAALNLIANFVWLPYQPVWAIISVAIDVFVIWALCAGRPKPVI